MHCNYHIHDLDLQDNLDSVHNFEGPSIHLSWVHKIQKRSVQGECEHHYQLSFRQQLSSELVSALLFPFLLLPVARSLASQYLWANYLQHLCFVLLLVLLHLPILFMMGDPEPKCSEFIPSALVWLPGPCPWLFPGNIASNYTTRGAQPLRYHAKFQTDLITTTSRKRTQWGRPPPRRVFNQNTKPQNNGSHCTSRSTLFHTGKRKRQSKLAVHAACTVLCWSSCTCPVLNTAAESHRFHKNKLSFSLVNSEWMNSPTSPKNHSK